MGVSVEVVERVEGVSDTVREKSEEDIDNDVVSM